MHTTPSDPKFGRGALRWLRCRIADVLSAHRLSSPRLEAAMLDWYCEAPRAYVRWVAAVRYSGRGFASGGWEVVEQAVLDHAKEAVIQASRRVASAETAAMGSLDEWLAADLAGTLTAAPIGGSADLPAERRAALRQAKEFRAQLADARIRNRNRRVPSRFLSPAAPPSPAPSASPCAASPRRARSAPTRR